MDTSSAVNLPEIPQGLTLEGVWNWFLSMLPVSYTHLDVYKRQALTSSGFWP